MFGLPALEKFAFADTLCCHKDLQTQKAGQKNSSESWSQGIA